MHHGSRISVVHVFIITIYNSEIWFRCSTNAKKDKFVDVCSVIGFYDNLQDKVHNCILNFSTHITSDSRHFLNNYMYFVVEDLSIFL